MVIEEATSLKPSMSLFREARAGKGISYMRSYSSVTTATWEFPMLPPSPANRYHVDHAERLRRTFHTLTGRDLVDPALAPDAAADVLFHAAFVVLSHNTAPDPLLTYGNQAALNLFALTWENLIQMPSRLTAEAPNQAGRARLLAEVTARGYIDDYSGVRISRTGQRFLIERATVWNLTDAAGQRCGQAAMFREWRYLDNISSG